MEVSFMIEYVNRKW